ncbi:unnamed protein product [Mesocestoides corti]|uniref:Uncharacterized protein n=1 Tax=Mesocestoides corti TaxID=53468 RepID=A0A0R3UC78_MESCO|nr:unnamed protein product [Mesocestoides corti]
MLFTCNVRILNTEGVAFGCGGGGGGDAKAVHRVFHLNGPPRVTSRIRQSPLCVWYFDRCTDDATELDSRNLGWSTGSGESQQEPLPKEQSTTTMTPPPLPPPLATTASAFMGHAVAAFVELTHKNSGEGFNVPGQLAFLTSKDVHRDFPPLFRDASTNGHPADPPTQDGASNGVGLFVGFAESIAVSFQEVREQPNSPSPLGVTGDVWSVRFEGYHKEVCRRSRSALTLLRCEKLNSTWKGPRLVSAVAASRLQVGGEASIPDASPSPARPTVVCAIVLAHSQDVGGRVCVCSVTALRRLPPLSSSLP